MPRHVNTNAWLMAGWLAVTLMSVGPAPAQSPDAVAAAKELMATMKSADQFKAIMPSLMKFLPACLAARSSRFGGWIKRFLARASAATQTSRRRG